MSEFAPGTADPRPVGQLTSQDGAPDGLIPIDEPTARQWRVEDTEFVSYGSYGVRFVLHDEVVDVYLAPNPAGGFY